jgi:thioesterase domain-containing protein
MAQNAVFQHNTSLALVDHLTTLLDTTEPAPVPAQPSGVEQLYRQAMALGRNDLAMDLLGVASQLRPTFTAATDEVTIPEPVHLVPRTARPTLVCFPSFVATVGQFHYARLAKWFQDEYGVTALLNPGYGPDEPVPADLDALVDAHLRAIATHLDGDQRIVLLGHSAGGLIAHAVATGLDRAGRRPDGLVLLDPPWPGEVGDGELAALAREFLVRQEGEPQDGSFSAWLTTLGAYLRAIDGWTPQPHTVRTLVLRATGELPSGADPTGADLRLRADWRLPHDLIDVPGDHFSLVEAHAETTAQAVRAWLAHLA